MQLASKFVNSVSKISNAYTHYRYIMTSDHTQQLTETFFKENNYFGYSRDHVIFFEQFNIPVLSLQGKVLMKDKNSICWSPGKLTSPFVYYVS